MCDNQSGTDQIIGDRVVDIDTYCTNCSDYSTYSVTVGDDGLAITRRLTPVECDKCRYRGFLVPRYSGYTPRISLDANNPAYRGYNRGLGRYVQGKTHDRQLCREMGVEHIC